jgi:hypothetical protein
MDSVAPGELVTFSEGGPPVDAIVFDTPSRNKVVVALVDQERGPILKTVSPKTLSAREEEGPDDRAIHLLMRRTPPPSRGSGGGGPRGGRALPAHARGAMHRPTGR